MLVKAASVFSVFFGPALVSARLARSAALRVDEGSRVPLLEASRIKSGIPDDLVEMAGEEAVEGCLVKGKINGKDSTMYMRVNEEGDTIIHHYDGDTSHLNKIRMLPGKFFPVTYDDGCEAYVDGIHSVWYTRDNKYRAAVDEASAGGAPIADAFVQNMFDKVITA